MMHSPPWLAELTLFILRVRDPVIASLVDALDPEGRKVDDHCDQEIIISFRTPIRHDDAQRSFDKGMNMEATSIA